MQVGGQQSGREGEVGWGCLPGPSLVCPHRRSRSGLHHPSLVLVNAGVCRARALVSASAVAGGGLSVWWSASEMGRGGGLPTSFAS